MSRSIFFTLVTLMVTATITIDAAVKNSTDSNSTTPTMAKPSSTSNLSIVPLKCNMFGSCLDPAYQGPPAKFMAEYGRTTANWSSITLNYKENKTYSIIEVLRSRFCLFWSPRLIFQEMAYNGGSYDFNVFKMHVALNSNKYIITTPVSDTQAYVWIIPNGINGGYVRCLNKIKSYIYKCQLDDLCRRTSIYKKPPFRLSAPSSETPQETTTMTTFTPPEQKKTKRRSAQPLTSNLNGIQFQ